MIFENWLAFCAIAFIATATPGPAVLLVSTNSLAVGFKKSLITVLGNVSGLFIMSACSVLGLSAIVLQSTMAFTTIKILGAFYLIHIGIKLWKNGISTMTIHESESVNNSFFSLYTQGILIALTNPKAIVFTTALFPQFIIISEPLLPQFTVLVVSFMTLSFLCLSSYSILVQRMKAGTTYVVPEKILGKVCGSTFIGAGCFLATASR